MYTRIAAALMVAFLLAAGGWKAYVMGGNAVQAKWTAERLQTADAALKASEAARAKEQTLIAKNAKVTHDYIVTKNAAAAAAAVSADRLRDLQVALDSAASSDSAPLGGADDPRGRIAGQCAAALGVLDGYAQDVAAKATALQNYANSVRVTP